MVTAAVLTQAANTIPIQTVGRPPAPPTRLPVECFTQQSGTGSEIIEWGGNGVDAISLNTGGRYNPNTDSWTATSTTNAPAARELHTAVWTGSEMIVWGGLDVNYHDLNTGGRYCAQSGPTPTPTPTATPTPTPCTGRCTPTPRPRPTPAPRP